MMTFEQLCNNVDVDMLEKLVDECNGWNGSLEEYRVYQFDDLFFEVFFNNRPMEAARATFFGNIQNWHDDYIYFNAYGNLESMTDYRYYKLLEENKEEIIETALQLYRDVKLDFDSEIVELFDEYFEEEER